MSNIQGTSMRGLPGKTPNNQRGPVRTSQYGELVTMPAGQSRFTMADQGNYYTARNPVIDVATTIVGHAAPLLADCDATMTKPLIHMRMSPSSGLRAYLDFIELDVATAPTNGAKDNWAAQLDTGATRVTTAGTTLTQVNSNMQATATGDLAIQAGVVIVGAETTSVRNLGSGMTRSGIAIVGDRYVFKFGSEPTPGDNVASAAASRHHISMPPVILGPQDQFLLALYSADDNQTVGAVYKIRIGWWEL